MTMPAWMIAQVLNCAALVGFTTFLLWRYHARMKGLMSDNTSPAARPTKAVASPRQPVGAIRQ
jgi:hypothetical protein